VSIAAGEISSTPSGDARGKQLWEDKKTAGVSPRTRTQRGPSTYRKPQDVVEGISELLTPGYSLSVSDSHISGETGKDTDFIVVTQ